jgi:hypothetical protein
MADACASVAVAHAARARRRTACAVPGRRRGEVAALADVSVEYYATLERGNLAGVSPGVLDAIARPRRPAARQETAHPSLQWTLDAVTAGPAFVCNGRLDLLATNQLARAFYCDLHTGRQRPANLARYAFLDPAARRFYADWERIADQTHFHHPVVGDLTLAWEGLEMVAAPGLRLLSSWAATQESGRSPV